MTRWFDAMRVAQLWPDAWIIEEQIRKEYEEQRERARLELPLAPDREPGPEDDAPPRGERPAGGTVIVIDL